MGKDEDGRVMVCGAWEDPCRMWWSYEARELA